MAEPDLSSLKGVGRPLRTLTWTALAEWIPRLIGFAILLLIARRLGPPGFGTFSLVFAWVHLCWGAVDVGTSNYALRLLAEEPARRFRILAELLTLNVSLAGLTVIVAAAVGLLVLRDPSSRTTLLVMLLFLFTFAIYPDWFLRGTTALPTLAMGNFAVAGLWLVLTFGFASLSQPTGYALAWALSPLAGAAVFWSRYRKSAVNLRRGIEPREWLAHVRTSGLFAVSGGLSNATIPIVSTGLQIIGGSALLGSYTVGLRVAAVIAGALLIALQNLTPYLVRFRAEINQFRFVGLGLLGGLSLFALAIVIVPLGLTPLLGGVYGPGAPVVVMGFATIVPWSAKYPIELLLVSHHADLARVRMQLVSLAVVGAAISCAFIWHASAFVIVGYVAAEATAAGVGWVMLRRASSPG